MTPLVFDAVDRVVFALGWMLLHFMWQGALVAAAWASAKPLLRASSSGFRYGGACLALIVMVLLPAATFCRHVPAAAASTGRGIEEIVESGAETEPPLLFTGIRPSPSRASESRSKQGSLLDSVSLRLQRIPTVFPAVVGLWICGILFFAARFFGGWWVTRRTARTGLIPVSSALRKKATELAERLGVVRAVAVYESLSADVPMIIGWLKPTILLPTAALTGLPPAHLEAVLIHELAHVRRHDYLVNLLQTVVETLLFHHPAVWWISREIRIEREHCCDDIAVAATGDALGYARALTDLEHLRQGEMPPALALAANGGLFMNRIRRLVLPQSKGSSSSLIAGIACLLLTFSLFTSALSSNFVSATADGKSSNRTLAVGFVALPVHDGTPVETTRLLTESLARHHVPAVGFVQGGLLTKDSEARLEALRLWRDADLEIGIGSYSHKHFFSTTYEDYLADVVKNEETVRPLLAERGQGIHRYSYPFLNTGPDAATKERFEQYLRKRGWSPTPYTIDNDDWFFGKVYTEAMERGDGESMRRIKAEYVPYMRRMFEFYEAYSRELLGREIPQILLLTPSRLNADCAEELFGMIEKRGYRFVTMDEATSDAAFASQDAYTGKTGISWLQRWGITRGGAWRDEPRPGGYMEQFNYHKGAGNLKAKK